MKGVALCLIFFMFASAAMSEENVHPIGCDIKGNRGKNKLRFYVPGHPTYEKVKINKRGERWFCSEEQALEAGWQPAGSIEGRSDKTRLLQQTCLPAAEAPPGCAIKGNINSRHDRIFHAPCTTYYTVTEIRVEDGERWFCSEAEAIAAGWRAPRGH